MRRTLQGMMASVQRSLAGANVPLGEILKALDTAHKDVHNGYQWPWSLKDTNLLVTPPYSTGTVSITNGTAIVTGLGTAWNTTWTGMRLRVGQSNVDYIVASVDSPTQITLAQVVNLGASLSAAAYSLYKDTYALPADCDIGKDMLIYQQTLRYQIRHIPRYQFEQQSMVIRQMFTNLTMFYADTGCDPITGCYQVRFMPPISTVGEYRLTYRSRPLDLTVPTQTTLLPDGYDEILEFMAESKLKMMFGLPNAEAPMAMATGKIKALRKQIETATIDNSPMPSGIMPDSSISEGGLSILPWQP